MKSEINTIKGDLMNSIIIDIKSDIEQIDGENQTIEMMTEAELYEKNGSIFIIYFESEVSGMAGCKTMLKLSNNTITMTRFGDTNSKIVFDLDQPMTSVYKTAYGDFDMNVTTLNLVTAIDVDNQSGYLEIEYQMVLEHLSSSHNHLVIKVRS